MHHIIVHILMFLQKKAWSNACPTKVIVDDTTYAMCNVIVYEPSSSVWTSMFGSGYYAGQMLAYTKLISTDNIEVNSVATAQACSRRIKIATIYFNPDHSVFGSSSNRTNNIRRTYVHELGHVLGLGHPNTEYLSTNEPSVMRQNVTNVTYEGYYIPQQHDISDIIIKY